MAWSGAGSNRVAAARSPWYRTASARNCSDVTPAFGRVSPSIVLTSSIRLVIAGPAGLSPAGESARADLGLAGAARLARQCQCEQDGDGDAGLDQGAAPPARVRDQLRTLDEIPEPAEKGTVVGGRGGGGGVVPLPATHDGSGGRVGGWGGRGRSAPAARIDRQGSMGRTGATARQNRTLLLEGGRPNAGRVVARR